MNQEQKRTVLDRWQNSAPYWEKYRALIAEFFTPVTAALIESARIAPGQQVLDIGGGSGEPSLTISRVVGPTGLVVFSDPASAMVEAARTEANRQELKNLRFEQCPGDDLPFASDTFDAVVGRFSAMFFSDPPKAAREALRVVRREGCVSFAVWGSAESNPFLSIISDVIDRFVDDDVPEDPDAPDAFRFATPGRLAGILKETQAGVVTERVLDFRIQAPIAFDQFWQLRTEMSDMLRGKLARLAPAQVSVAKNEVIQATRKYFSGGPMNFPAQALIVSATKSG
jgi:SAM-dependent methyltransferase